MYLQIPICKAKKPREGKNAYVKDYLLRYLVSCFSAGVGRAGTFCVIYSAIRELNGTGNIGKDTAMLNNNYALCVFISSNVFPIGIFIQGSVNYLRLWVSGCVVCTCHPLFIR